MTNIVQDWTELLLDAIRLTKPGPPMVARSIAIVYTCIYDAWAAYDSVANLTRTDFAATAPGNAANVATSVHFAAYRALVDQYPKAKNALDAKMTLLGLSISDTTLSVSSPVGVGNKAAKQVLTFRQTDGANEAGNYADTSGYMPVNNPIRPFFATTEDIPFPDRWQPLTYLDDDNRPATPSYIGAHWGEVTPFALTSSSQFRPVPPQLITSQGFLEQARHVIDVQANLTPKQKVMAEYWADGPRSELPPGHWLILATFVVERDRLNLAETIKLFFALSNAVFDASIATWEAKRFYDYCRPITAIRYLFRGKTIKAWGGAGKGVINMPGELWRPFQVDNFPTPPFSEYVSGHSTFSMAAATVLKAYTGSDEFGYFYMQRKPLAADPHEEVLGILLSWNTFRDAALDAGESRIYGGIHFYEGNVSGLELGKKVGANAFEKARAYWTGTV
ncbi:vanadium-dependent haloperoxidase [Hymenobacter sp. ISL-91]|uniref:vanadium-dependent haloperoxidase n=1 Tax=Hymenobacter sp. ISL-91 TaxID=2819151 RepID=UPI001BEA45E8|nr:vanadium-dependent haloperoxidase [Hymenobacter sp. ISL-91]MBT2557414.1 vanadium-dependent haloperoxidase [Hymenobacter sp. ISL-91]